MPLNIVLVEPEIPQNTGNIARTCAAAGAALHLVGKLGFSTDNKYLKRAGLDYWHMLDVFYYQSLDELMDENTKYNFFYLSTKAKHVYTEIDYPENTFLVFGKETKGLPEILLLDNIERCIRIPMIEGSRSLNLSNSVAIAVYEYLRQKSFKGLCGGSKYFNP